MKNLRSFKYLAIPILFIGCPLLGVAQKSDMAKPNVLVPINYKAPNVVKTNTNMVFLDIDLNYFSVSETTRNRIDNGDCKRVFGQITCQLWGLDEHNNKIKAYSPYDRKSTRIFDQNDKDAPPPIALSHYQSNTSVAANEVMNSLTFNVPSVLLETGKIMLVVRIQLGTRHKDNDFASYDFLCMEQPIERSFVLNSTYKKIDIKTNTNEKYSGRDLHINDMTIPFAVFRRTDDTHNIWVHLTCKPKK